MVPRLDLTAPVFLVCPVPKTLSPRCVTGLTLQQILKPLKAAVKPRARRSLSGFPNPGPGRAVWRGGESAPQQNWARKQARARRVGLILRTSLRGKRAKHGQIHQSRSWRSGDRVGAGHRPQPVSQGCRETAAQELPIVRALGLWCALVPWEECDHGIPRHIPSTLGLPPHPCQCARGRAGYPTAHSTTAWKAGLARQDRCLTVSLGRKCGTQEKNGKQEAKGGPGESGF